MRLRASTIAWASVGDGAGFLTATIWGMAERRAISSSLKAKCVVLGLL